MEHTEHCQKRMKWGDGECECGVEDRTSASSDVAKQFVTARLMGKADCRQGVLIEHKENSIIVQGMLDTYECEKDYAVVPLCNLWGKTRAFAIKLGVIA